MAGLDTDAVLVDAFDVEQAVLAGPRHRGVDMTCEQGNRRLLIEAGVADDPSECGLVFPRAKAIEPFGRDVRRCDPGLVEQARLAAVEQVHGGRRLDRQDLRVREREEKVAFLRVLAREGARPLFVRLALHEDVKRFLRREDGGVAVEFTPDGRNDSVAGGRQAFRINLWEQTPRLQAILLRWYTTLHATLPQDQPYRL
ncbi:MAG: hypothetical protein RLZZ360_654 [Candidatus Parcubacteria bacterium]